MPYDEEFYKRHGNLEDSGHYFALAEAIGKHFKGYRLIDFGAGMGHLVKHLKHQQFDIRAFDISEFAVAHSDGLVELQDALQFSEPDYNVALCIGLLQHLRLDEIAFFFNRLHYLGLKYVVIDNGNCRDELTFVRPTDWYEGVATKHGYKVSHSIKDLINNQGSWGFTVIDLQPAVEVDTRQVKTLLVDPGCIDDVQISVIITCHNYARFLIECIESVLKQTRPADEIIIIDDASDDETPNIAQSYATNHNIVKHYRVNFRSVATSRNFGFEKSRGDYLLFLDADNHLPKNFLKKCLNCMSDPRVAVAYPDVKLFGDRKHYERQPEFDSWELTFRNFAENCSLIRRLPLQMVGLWNDVDEGHPDWNCWIRLLHLGFHFKRAETFVNYRVHGASQGHQLGFHQQNKVTEFHAHTFTVAITFGGHHDYCWEQFRNAVERLDIPRERTCLLIVDDSENHHLETTLRKWLQSSTGWMETHYIKSRRRTDWYSYPGVCMWPNEEPVIAAIVAYNINLLKQIIHTDFVLMLESDVIVPQNAFWELLRGLPHFGGAISANYPCRNYMKPMAWKEVQTYPYTHEWMRPQNGIQRADGIPFGCLLIRTGVLKRTVVRPWIGRPEYWRGCDVALGRDLTYLGVPMFIHWDIRCEHHIAEGKYLISGDPQKDEPDVCTANCQLSQ